MAKTEDQPRASAFERLAKWIGGATALILAIVGFKAAILQLFPNLGAPQARASNAAEQSDSNLQSSNASEGTTTDAGVTAPTGDTHPLARDIFSTGVRLPAVSAAYGEKWDVIGRGLDPKLFATLKYEDLAIASEYKNEEVRYLWVQLNTADTVSYLNNSDKIDGKCITSGYAFLFFKYGEFFKTSLRFTKNADCQSYDWLRKVIFGKSYSTVIKTPIGSSQALYAEDNEIAYFEAWRIGEVLDEPSENRMKIDSK